MRYASQPDSVPDIASPKRDKRQKFVQLGEKRTKNAIKAIRVIGNLGNRAHYEFDENDVRKIVSALSKEVDALKQKLSHTTHDDKIGFRL